MDMSYWIEYMREELSTKDKKYWDETDWDAYYYLESLK